MTLNFDLEGDLWDIRYWSHWSLNIDLTPIVVFWNSIIFKLKNYRYSNFDLEFWPWRWPHRSSVYVSLKSQHQLTPRCRLLESPHIQIQKLYGIFSLTLNCDLEGDLRGHCYRCHWNRNINLPQVTYLQRYHISELWSSRSIYSQYNV